MFKKVMFRSMLLLSIAGSMMLTGCSKQASQTPAQLTISAAASLTDAMKEIQTNYEKKHTNIKLLFNFGASGALQQQIEQGAPADVFFSAASKNMKELVDKSLIDASQQSNLLLNGLVVVVPADSKTSVQKLEDLSGASVAHIAVGEPQTVPAGTYAREALTNAKLWDPLQAKIVQGKDVRQVLTYVESGNAEAGFVYKTDALTSSKVKIALTVDPKSYKPIEYPAGIVKASKHSKEAAEFYAYLKSKEAQDVFVKFGFTIPQ